MLFAPAHSGAYAADIASAYLTSQDWWLGKIAGAAAAYNLPLLEDLKPGSVVLTALDADTKTALQAKPKAGHLVAHTVVWPTTTRSSSISDSSTIPREVDSRLRSPASLQAAG